MPCVGSVPTFLGGMTVSMTNCRISASVVVDVPCGSSGWSIAMYARPGATPHKTSTERFYASSISSGPATDSHNGFHNVKKDATWYLLAVIECDGTPVAQLASTFVVEECTPPDEGDPPHTATPHEGVDEVIYLVKVAKVDGEYTYTDKRILSMTYQMIDWFYYRNGGCGNFQLMLRESFPEADVAIKYGWEVHVRIRLTGETTWTTWYRGVIRSSERRRQGNEISTLVRGQGYLEQLANIQVQRRYPKGLTIAQIVNDIIDNYIKPNSRVRRPLDVSGGIDSGVDDSTYVTRGPLHFETNALKALKFLAELQGDREYGVSSDRAIYFRTKKTTFTDALFSESGVVSVLDGGKEVEKVNQLKMNAKQWGHRETLFIRPDVTDITQYGLFEKNAEVPWVEHEQDASRWADNIIAKRKNATQWRSLAWSLVDKRLERNHPTQGMGMVRYYGTDVSNQYDDLDLSKIHYYKGGLVAKGEVREIRDAKVQSLIDQPILRARVYLGAHHHDLAEDLEDKIYDPMRAIQGKARQMRESGYDVTVPDPNIVPLQPAMLWGVAKTNDITNAPYKQLFRDATNWAELVKMRTGDVTTPQTGDFLGEEFFVYEDAPTRSRGTKYYWDGVQWVAIRSSGGGSADYLNIGDAVIGGTPNHVLYVGSTGLLAQDSDLMFDGNNLTVGVGSLPGNARVEIRSAGSKQLRLSYGGSSFADFTVGAAGALTITATLGVNIESANDADVAGTFAVGIAGSHRMVFHHTHISNPGLILYNTAGAIVNTLSISAGGPANVLNEQGADIDTRAEAVGDPNCFFLDASLARVGVGTGTLSAKFHVLSTTEQLRLGYDATNYVSFTVGSTGNLTIANVGTNPGTIVSQWLRVGTATEAVAQGDFSFGNSASNRGFWDQSANTLTVGAITSYTGVAIIEAVGGSATGAMAITGGSGGGANVGTLDFIRQGTGSLVQLEVTRSGANDAGLLTIYTKPSGGALTNRLSIAPTGATTIAQWLNGGSAADAVAIGDLCFGASGVTGQRIFYDQSAHTLNLNGGTAPQINFDPKADVGSSFDFNILTVSTQAANVRFNRLTNTAGSKQVVFFRGDGTATISHSLSMTAGTATVFNENGEDIDTRIEAVGDPNCLWVDASLARAGVGTGTLSAKFHVLSTTEQLRLGYDATNYVSLTVTSGGQLVADVSGDVIQVRSGTTGQTINLYNTYTSDVNNELCQWAWSSNVLFFRTGTTGGTARNMTVGTTGAASFIVQTNSADRITVASTGATTIHQWENVGTTTLATTQGDFAAGLSGAAQMFYDQSLGRAFLYDTGAAINITLDGAAATITIGAEGVRNGIINSVNSLYLNIDSNNDQTGQAFVFGINRTGGAGGTELANMTEAGVFTWRGIASGGFIINEDGVDSDTRIEGDTDANLTFWDASTDRVGIGTATPGTKLDVRGNINVGSATAATDASIEVGANSSGNRYAFIDLIGDGTYTDYGLRIIRNNGGANTNSLVVHRGTGALALQALEAGVIQFETNTVTRAQITSRGNLLLGTTTDATANDGKVLIFGDNAAQPTLGANTAGVYGYDSGSGTVELWAVDEAGNDTQLSPHDKDGHYYFHSRNRKTRRTLKIHMEKLVKYLIEKDLIPSEFYEESYT